MKTVYFVRHGEAENNMRSTIEYEGRNASLTDKGIEQAGFIAERAFHLTVEVIISSTFQRAKQTAAVIKARIEKPIEYSDHFVERQNPTGLMGRPWLDPNVQKIHKAWEKSFYTGARIDDGETFLEVRERAQKALAYLENRSESNIIVVTHGFFLRMLVAALVFGEQLTPQLFEPMDMGIRTTNTGLTVVKYDPEDKHKKWWLLVWNDHAHLW